MAIHKDKNKKNVSLERHIAEQVHKHSKKTQIPVSMSKDQLDKASGKKLINPETPVINEEQLLKKEKAIQEYNENIKDLDPDYTSVVPNNKVLVRVFHLNTERTAGGLIIEPTVRVKIPTRSGYGYIGDAESPWQYSQKCVIVSVPAGTSEELVSKLSNGEEMRYKNPLRVGSVCQLGPSALQPKGGSDGAVDIPSAYTLPEWPDGRPPTDLNNKHFGYLMVSRSDIIAFLQDDNS